MIESIPLRHRLAALIEDGASGSLRYHRNKSLIAHLARRIEEALPEDVNPEGVLEVVRVLVADLDYRLVADYLRALRAGDAPVVSTFERVVATESAAGRNRLLYEVARARFSHTAPPVSADTTVFVERLEDLFSHTGHQPAIYFNDDAFGPALRALLGDVGARLGDFIEQQYDLPCINALVRQGVVKSWYLPDGTEVVSKRDNPQKPGRFRVEQLNYEAVSSRMADCPTGRLLLGWTAGGGNVWLATARPFAVLRDGHSQRCYALSARILGTTLQDLLLDEREPVTRRTYLAHYRALLDAFYDRGILWGDMSPRNIIVRQDGTDTVYHIFDFEKTRVLDGPAAAAERVAHCRGQVCVEELGVICTREEVEECFRGYFAPAAWELESDAPVPFDARPEVADVLRGRGLRDATLGTYNRTDLEIMCVRAPDTNPATGLRRFPSHLNFKVEHYLSCAGRRDASDYDRKTTEVLIAAKRHGCFDAAVAALTAATDRVENAFLEEEFEGILGGRRTRQLTPPRRVVEALVDAVDALYQRRARAEDFRRACDELGSDTSTGLD